MADPTRPDDLKPYVEAGWELIPLHRWDEKGKKGQPVGKAPRDAGWRKMPYSAKRVGEHVAGGANAGVRLRAQDLVMDVDPRNFPAGRDCLAEIAQDLDLDLTRMPHVYTGSGGHHYYMQKDPDTEVRAGLDGYPGIEFKTHGTQVVSAGSVHPCGRRYRWDDLDAVPLGEAPQVPERLMGMIRRASMPPQGEGGQLTPEQLERLLSHLDPVEFRDYDRWLKVMMACHHATDGRGMDEFLDWSAGDPKYSGDRGANALKWDTFHGQGSRGKVTVGTLYREINAIKDDAARARAQADIPRDAAAEDFPDAAPEDGPPKTLSLLAQLNQTHWATLSGGKFRVYSRVNLPVGDGKTSRMTWVSQNAYDFKLFHDHKKVEVNNKMEPLGSTWLEWHKRRTVDGVIFDPARNWEGFLNLWQGFAVQPRKGDWSLMQELIRDVLCDGDEGSYEYVLDWLAYAVQSPADRPEVALVFRGGKGTGKGTLGRALLSLFGVHGFHISNPSHLVGKFNAHLRDCVAMFADEAFYAGDRVGEQVLKQIITEPTLLYEPKGVDAAMGQNHVHLIMASNERWVIPAGIDGERRFAVFDVSNRRQGQKVGFFDPLNRQMERGGLQAMLFDLLARDLKGRHPRDHVPRTRALTQQKINSLHGIPAWWHETLSNGALPQPVWGDWRRGKVAVLAQDVQEAVQRYLAEASIKGGSRSIGTQLGSQLMDLIPGLRKDKARVPEARVDVSGHGDGRAYVYVFPPLEECRRQFAEGKLGDPTVAWDPVEDDEAWLR